MGVPLGRSRRSKCTCSRYAPRSFARMCSLSGPPYPQRGTNGVAYRARIGCHGAGSESAPRYIRHPIQSRCGALESQSTPCPRCSWSLGYVGAELLRGWLLVRSIIYRRITKLIAQIEANSCEPNLLSLKDYCLLAYFELQL